MIPKIIHYCWFGKGEMPDTAKKCIESWKKILPEYKLICWNEESFDISCNEYVKEAYDAKKYAFVSDYVRLYALVNFGGIYMDTDVEVLKPLDEYLNYVAFSGFENELFIPTGIMACEKGYKCFVDLLNQYNDRHFIMPDGSYDLTTNVKVITDYYVHLGLCMNNSRQIISDFLLMPSITFCPAPEDIRKANMEKIVTIHYKNGSWLSKKAKKDSFLYKVKIQIKKYMKIVLGRERYGDFMRFIYKKKNK